MDSNFFESIHHYCQINSDIQPDYLYELERDTYIKTREPHMLSGALQGRFLSLISKLMYPKCILEIGTFTGFSALCLAEGLATNGILHTIEIDEEKESICKQYFNKSPYANVIQLYIGNALDIIPQLNISPDIIFIDADKINYKNYYELSLSILATNGIIIADNILFHGQVLLDESQQNKNAKAVVAFNDWVKNDERVEQVILPIRDGLSLIRKK
jgi:caffeoyl-CoA O-methyltransferase